MKLPDDYTVRLLDLPVDCGGMVSMSPDGHYSIFLNARLSHAMQQKKFKHEIAHITNDDFNNSDDIRTIEARADGLPAPSKSLPPLMRARDLLPPPHSLPLQGHRTPGKQSRGLFSARWGRQSRGMVAPAPLGSDEVASPLPQSPVPRPPASLSPRQAAVLLHAVNDLDALLFNPDCDF